MCDKSPHDTFDNKCSSMCLSHRKAQMHDSPHSNEISSHDILCQNIPENISKGKNISDPAKLAGDKVGEAGGTRLPPLDPHSPHSQNHTANNISQPLTFIFQSCD